MMLDINDKSHSLGIAEENNRIIKDPVRKRRWYDKVDVTGGICVLMVNTCKKLY